MRAAYGAIGALGLAALCSTPFARAENPADGPDPENAVERLRRRLEHSPQSLERTPEHGYLPALLKALDVPPESQALVFSRTSFQARHISSDNPRALYFGDEIYVGWVPGSDVVELSTADPKLGTAFYTLDQRAERPRLDPRGDECRHCHEGPMTGGVPGHLVRSVHPDARGFPIMRLGSFSVDHTTPLASRWGGWFVTGAIGENQHLGNRVFDDSEGPARAKPITLPETRRRYLAPGSDVVALMVLEHQTMVHNRIARADAAAREALAYERELRPLLRPGSDPNKDTPLESTQRRIDAVVGPLVDALLYADEAGLLFPLHGPSAFARAFEARGPRDKRGRSLRELDLGTRLFRYPLSYLVYTPAFARLHPAVRAPVIRRLGAILSGKDPARKYAHLTLPIRAAILEILGDTLPGLSADWGAK